MCTVGFVPSHTIIIHFPFHSEHFLSFLIFDMLLVTFIIIVHVFIVIFKLFL